MGHESGGFFTFLMVPILFFIGIIVVFGLGSLPAIGGNNQAQANPETSVLESGIKQLTQSQWPDSSNSKYQPNFNNGYIGGWAFYLVDVIGASINQLTSFFSIISIIFSQANGVGQLLSSPLAIFIYVVMVIMLVVAIVIRIW